MVEYAALRCSSDCVDFDLLLVLLFMLVVVVVVVVVVVDVVVAVVAAPASVAVVVDVCLLFLLLLFVVWSAVVLSVVVFCFTGFAAVVAAAVIFSLKSLRCSTDLFSFLGLFQPYFLTFCFVEGCCRFSNSRKSLNFLGHRWPSELDQGSVVSSILC